MATALGFQSMGVGLSIDDFGTGFSSLSYLRTLPASEIKIDQSFVANLCTDARDEVIVRSTIDLGHNLGLKVVAEGAETGETIDRLRALGCDLVQGYGISRPMSLPRFLVWRNSGVFPVAPCEAAQGELRVPSSAVDPIEGRYPSTSLEAVGREPWSHGATHRSPPECSVGQHMATHPDTRWHHHLHFMFGARAHQMFATRTVGVQQHQPKGIAIERRPHLVAGESMHGAAAIGEPGHEQGNDRRTGRHGLLVGDG